MLRQTWVIIALLSLFLLKGTGLYAMVHCQAVPANVEASITTHHQGVTTEHGHANASQVSDSNALFDTDLTSVCQACDDCCTIHCVAFPVTPEVSISDTHDKVLQYTYFHSSAIVPTQERPPKFA
jgi:hypothetical protein